MDGPRETSRSPGICMDQSPGAQQKNQGPQPSLYGPRTTLSHKERCVVFFHMAHFATFSTKRASQPTMIRSPPPFRIMKPVGPRRSFQVYNGPLTLIWVHDHSFSKWAQSNFYIFTWVKFDTTHKATNMTRTRHNFYGF